MPESMTVYILLVLVHQLWNLGSDVNIASGGPEQNPTAKGFLYFTDARWPLLAFSNLDSLVLKVFLKKCINQV